MQGVRRCRRLLRRPARQKDHEVQAGYIGKIPFVLRGHLHAMLDCQSGQPEVVHAVSRGLAVRVQVGGQPAEELAGFSVDDQARLAPNAREGAGSAVPGRSIRARPTPYCSSVITGGAR